MSARASSCSDRLPIETLVENVTAAGSGGRFVFFKKQGRAFYA
jgi:hypothetical protein